MRDTMGVSLLTAVLVLSVVAVPVGAVTTAETPETSGDSVGECTFPVTMTDATGTDVTLSEEPTRIVTVNPSAAQILWEIGAREKVVGLSKYASNLEGAESRINVSTTENIANAEKVVGAEPDLVLVPNATSEETVQQLREAGLTVYHFSEAETMEDIQSDVKTTGRLVGACAGAEKTVAEMERDLDVVRETVEGEDRPDVLYSFYGYTAGEGTFVHTIIETAGGNNVAADANITGYKPVNEEFVVDANPDWIIRNSDTPEVPQRDAYNITTAVKEGQVVVVQIEHLNRPGPRVVNAVTKLAKTFHPEAYAAANATETATPTAEPTPETTAASTSDGESETETSAPGFGVLSVLSAAAALGAASMLRRRRR
ncbi:PGF-CTERM-anchored ABC transporter substrate-binding protein [Halolamina sp.]|uniref:PGF-CTERM-anchored ABC transporter substrate-binding protein n=1 Tax=Halolamina sp. TaxID=1940283 RepID=UPI003561E2B0